MNLEEFSEKYPGRQHDKIEICCDLCGKLHKITRWRAEDNIRRNEKFIGRSCAAKRGHENNPRGPETREKQRMGRLGKKHSEEAKKKISEHKYKFYQTPEGIECKKRLSQLTAKNHSKNKFNNTRRKGWHISPKAGQVSYHSSYELRLFYHLDNDKFVKTYTSQISYVIDGRGRCMDALVEYIDGRKVMMEVKPEKRLREQNSIDQIADGRKFAKLSGWEFEVITENFFGMTCKEICEWADVFRSNSDVDFVKIRKENNCKKVKKHYKEKISKDKVKIYCEYCNITHEIMRKRYENNLQNNGRYICHRENGSIVGKRPKKAKENPYGPDKKKCSTCEEILPVENFSKGKGMCKKCRSEVYKKRYQEKRKNEFKKNSK